MKFFNFKCLNYNLAFWIWLSDTAQSRVLHNDTGTCGVFVPKPLINVTSHIDTRRKKIPCLNSHPSHKSPLSKQSRSSFSSNFIHSLFCYCLLLFFVISNCRSMDKLNNSCFEQGSRLWNRTVSINKWNIIMFYPKTT